MKAAIACYMRPGTLLYTQSLGIPISVSSKSAPNTTPNTTPITTTKTMAVTVDSLINQLIPLKPAAGDNLAALAKAGILEAIVLSSQAADGKAIAGKSLVNAELLKPSTTTNSDQQFKVRISVNNQPFELVTKVPIAAGTRIQFSVAQNNLATILNIASPTQTPGQTNTTISPASNTTLNAAPLVTGSTKPDVVPAINNRPAIEQGIRQALPQQQPLRNLLPLIQQIVQLPPQQIPRELLQNLNTLLQQFPTSQQVQQAKPLQQTLNNNGIFFEAKLAQQPAKGNTPLNPNDTTRLASNPINQDVKAILQKLVSQVDKPAAQQTTTTPLTSNTTDGRQALTYNPAALPPMTADIPISTTNSLASSEQRVDVLLKQLSNQLLASLARTQLNQLETLAARQANTPDNQGPVNSWTMELPIVHGKNIDNLELRIDQDLIEDEDQGETADGKKLWTVMLAFDLHNLGKMNVQLKVVEKSVSAVVWSQLENTHREVKQQVKSLSQSLEKVGVNVKHVDCQLGLPPKNNLPIYQQLVDVRT